MTSKIDTECRQTTGGGWSPLSKGGNAIYTSETFVRGKELLQKAQLKAGTDKEVLARIDYLNMWLWQADLSMKTLAAFRAYRSQPANEELKATFAQTKVAMDAFREAHAEKIVNIGFLSYLEGWLRL